MMSNYKAVIIGGSAGSFQVITRIISSLPTNYSLPVFLCLHRLKHIRSGFVEALSIKSSLPVIEPDDKDSIKSGVVYLAPANYHMYIELGNRFSLSTEEPVNHSRPSIDLSFMSAAYNYKRKLVGIILSGANKDGAVGLKKVKENGGLTIVQDPAECQVPTMPNACLQIMNVDHKYSTTEIVRFLNKIG
ncbi:MAG TPA: chemotaxis protein CheB [Salinivirgaceae bacterium]|nr:chemotaxis protein CheB [Salinivirgaceae bacterium]HQA75757.1 chemotaxis protein CheB [Salinivirgaceae bacterium]